MNQSKEASFSDAVFRIVFVVEADGDVLPLQQCLDSTFEPDNHVDSSA